MMVKIWGSGSPPLLLAFTAAVSLLAGLVFGMAPALQSAKPDTAAAMKGDGRGASGRSGTSRALVVVQMAMSLLLLMSAGLFVQSLDRAQSVDLGFDAERLAVVTLEWNETLPGAERTRIYRDVQARLGRMPDVAATGLPSGSFDRVVIVLALHEMPRAVRLAVLREAARLCRPAGRVVAVEHARPRSAASRFFQGLWWFFWLPGNPEAVTSRDMTRRGLDNEMRESGPRGSCLTQMSSPASVLRPMASRDPSGDRAQPWLPAVEVTRNVQLESITVWRPARSTQTMS